MKKIVIPLLLSLLLLSACFSNNTPILNNTDLNENTVMSEIVSKESSKVEQSQAASSTSNDINDFFQSYITEFPKYSYKGEVSITFDERLFILEDVPENVVEEIAVNNYYFPISGQFDKLLEIMGDNEVLKISAQNEQKSFEEGYYFNENIIHKISVLTEQDFLDTSVSDYFSNSEDATDFINELEAYISKYGLLEYTVVYIDLSWKWSENALQRAPQLDNGRYERLYLLGKTDINESWKIYEIFWGCYTLKRMYN